MKKKSLICLFAGIFMVGMVAIVQAGQNKDDIYVSAIDCDWGEFESAVSESRLEQILATMPAAGPAQENDDIYVEANDCDWDEFASIK